MPVVILKVVFSPTWGVFLGIKDDQGVWSKKDKVTGEERAPLFEDTEEFRKYWNENPALSEWPLDYHLQEVWSGGGKEAGATVEDCVRANLPRWGKQL